MTGRSRFTTRALVVTVAMLASLLVPVVVANPAEAQSRSTPCGTAPTGYNVIVSNAARINGTAGRDFICAGMGPNNVFAGAGVDIVYGRGGNDELHGGPGNDLLFGANGNDRLLGNQGTDLIRGGAGNDRIFGATGPDLLFGDPGRDVIYGGVGADFILGGSGIDAIHGGIGNDILWGNGGADKFFPGPGADVTPDRPGGFSTGNPALSNAIASIKIEYDLVFTGAGLAFKGIPFIAFKDGTYTSDFEGVMATGINASRASVPGKWGRWRNGPDGKFQRFHTGAQEWRSAESVVSSRPNLHASQRLNGCWEASSASGTLGQQETFSSRTFCFQSNGLFTQNTSGSIVNPTVVGGARSADSGFYELRGRVLTLIFGDGKIQTHLMGRFPTNNPGSNELVIAGGVFFDKND